MKPICNCAPPCDCEEPDDGVERGPTPQESKRCKALSGGDCDCFDPAVAAETRPERTDLAEKAIDEQGQMLSDLRLQLAQVTQALEVTCRDSGLLSATLQRIGSALGVKVDQHGDPEVSEYMLDYHAAALVKQLSAALAVIESLAWEAREREAEIDSAWLSIRYGWEIESREELERQSKTNGFKYGLTQAVHHMWKRKVKLDAPASAGPEVK